MYTTFAEQYDSAVQDNIYNAHLERPSLQAIIGDVNALDIIDLGCGTGVYAEYLISKGAGKLTCIDYSQEMINMVQRKFGERITAYAQDASIGLVKEESESADLIISPLMIHYLDDLSTLFTDIARVLKKGGSFAFSTHHPFADFECSLSGNYFERELITEMWDTVGEPIEVQFFRRSLTELVQALTNSGLVVTAISEGKVSEKVKEMSEERYEYLSKKPNFIFIKCQKLG